MPAARAALPPRRAEVLGRLRVGGGLGDRDGTSEIHETMVRLLRPVDRPSIGHAPPLPAWRSHARAGLRLTSDPGTCCRQVVERGVHDGPGDGEGVAARCFPVHFKLSVGMNEVAVLAEGVARIFEDVGADPLVPMREL